MDSVLRVTRGESTGRLQSISHGKFDFHSDKAEHTACKISTKFMISCHHISHDLFHFLDWDKGELQLMGHEHHDYCGPNLIWFGFVPESMPEPPGDFPADPFKHGESAYGSLRFKISYENLLRKLPGHRHVYALGTRIYQGEFSHTLLLTDKSTILAGEVNYSEVNLDEEMNNENKDLNFIFKDKSEYGRVWICYRWSHKIDKPSGPCWPWDHPELAVNAESIIFNKDDGIEISIIEHNQRLCVSAAKRHGQHVDGKSTKNEANKMFVQKCVDGMPTKNGAIKMFVQKCVEANRIIDDNQPIKWLFEADCWAALVKEYEQQYMNYHAAVTSPERLSIESKPESSGNSLFNKVYIIKCVLGFQLTEDNEDSRDDSFARIMALHVFNLNMCDIAETLNQLPNEISWDDTRIKKSLIITLLRGAEKNSDENVHHTSKATSVTPTDSEWTAEDDMAVAYALESYNLSLVDLKNYFYYDEDLLVGLQSEVNEGEAPESLDSSPKSKDDPTFSYKKVWKEVERTEGAIEALQQHHDNPNSWEISNAHGTRLARLAFGGNDGKRIAAVPNNNNTERVLLHVGNHNSYDTYRKKSHRIVVATFNQSDEKRAQSDLTFFEFMRNGHGIFDVATRLQNG